MQILQKKTFIFPNYTQHYTWLMFIIEFYKLNAN